MRKWKKQKGKIEGYQGPAFLISSDLMWNDPLNGRETHHICLSANIKVPIAIPNGAIVMADKELKMWQWCPALPEWRETTLDAEPVVYHVPEGTRFMVETEHPSIISFRTHTDIEPCEDGGGFAISLGEDS